MFDFLNPYMLWIKVAAGVAVFAAGGYAGYRWELSSYNALVAADAKAMTKAVQVALDKQKKIDGLNQGDAVDQAYFRGKLDGTIITLKTGAPLNVTVTQDQQAASTDHAGCITYGFYRMLAAGERGVTPDSLPLPSGQSVDSCTGVEPSGLATDTAQDLASGYANGHQLNRLITAVKRNDAIVAPAP